MTTVGQVVGRESRKRFLDVAENVLERFLSMLENPKPERKGCYICVMAKTGSKVLLISELGECDIKEADTYFKLSQEKAHRLLGHGHFSSWQSRDFDAGKYGGAITAPPNSNGYAIGREMVISISGLPEKGDEAVSLVIGLIFRWITTDDIKLITDISGNLLVFTLIKDCADLFDWDSKWNDEGKW